MARVTRALSVSVAGLALLVIHALLPTPVPAHLRVIAAFPGIAALVLWSRYLSAANVDKRFPFLEYAVTQFYLYWGLAAVTVSGRDAPWLGERAWAGALFASCLATAAVMAAHPLGRGMGTLLARPLGRLLPSTAPALSPFVILPWLALAMAVHAQAGVGVVPVSVYHVVNTVGDYSPLLVAIAWTDRAHGRPSVSFVACTAALSFAGLLTGMMEAVIQPVLTAVALYVVLHDRIPWRLLATGALLAIVLNPAKHVYREISWADGNSLETHVAKDPLVSLERWWKAVETAWGSGRSNASSNAVGLASRLDELTTNAVVLEKTPVSVPYDHGKNWTYIALSPVPRFLYPDKPNFTRIYNDRFNVMFGFQTPEGTEASTGAFPLVADGYWNFGWLGVALVALVTGCMIGFFSGAFRATSWAMASIAVSTFVHMHSTGCVGVQIMGVLQRFAGMSALLWVAWLGSRAVAPATKSDPRAGGAVVASDA